MIVGAVDVLFVPAIVLFFAIDISGECIGGGAPFVAAPAWPAATSMAPTSLPHAPAGARVSEGRGCKPGVDIKRRTLTGVKGTPGPGNGQRRQRSAPCACVPLFIRVARIVSFVIGGKRLWELGVALAAVVAVFIQK